MGFNETYGKLQTGIKIAKHISHTEWTETKKSLSLSLLCTFALEYTIRKVQDNQRGLDYIEQTSLQSMLLLTERQKTQIL